MNKILCLLYHRINSVDDDIYHLTVSPEHFEEQIRYLKENISVLRFEDEWADTEGPGVVITFDDGYADNYEYALPILEKYQLPATVFVCTGYVNSGREFWWDELVRILTNNIKYPDRFELRDSLYHYSWNTDTREKRIDLLKSLHWLLKMEWDIERAEFWLDQLRIWSGLGREGRRENLPVSVAQLQKLAGSNCITIGAHTVNHRSLGGMAREGQQYEIGASICYLEKILEKKIEVFSYPFGSPAHFNRDTFEICRQRGIIKAATTVKKTWNESIDPFAIPRMEVKDYCGKEFETFIQECLRVG